MDTPGTNPNDPQNVPDPPRERVVTTPTNDTSVYVSEQDEDVTLPIKNRIQWGPIVGGIVTALTIFLLMSILGIAIGASVLDPNNAGEDAGTWAAVWSAISAIVAFLVGGWVAAKTSAVGGSFGGLMNGFLVGAAGLLLVVYLTATGLGNLFGTLSSNAGDIINVAEQVAQEEGVTPEEAEQQAEEAAQEAQEAVEQIDPNEAFETVRNSAFGTFLGMLLPILAAGLGGYLGHNTRYEILTGGG
jgi:hypothetical protein